MTHDPIMPPDVIYFPVWSMSTLARIRSKGAIDAFTSMCSRVEDLDTGLATVTRAEFMAETTVTWRTVSNGIRRMADAGAIEVLGGDRYRVVSEPPEGFVPPEEREAAARVV